MLKVYEFDSNGYFVKGSMRLEDDNYEVKENEYAIPQNESINLHKFQLVNGELVEGETSETLLEQAKTDKKKEIFNDCKTDILNGFISTLTDVDGVAYEFFYDDTAQTKFNAQTNKLNIYMNQLSLGKITQTDYDAKFPIDWRTKSHGWVSFTDDEFVQLTDDAEAHERTNLQKRSQLEAQIDAATTVPDVEAIVW